MEILKEIRDKDIPKDKSIIKIRKAAQAILFDEDKLVPLLFVSKYKYHKLPGGGIDKGENKEKALIRECLEEIGKIIEFRSRWNLKQTSYCYYGKVTSKGNPNFTKKELNHGFKITWFSIKDAISTLENNRPENYEGVFIQKRDLEFLKKAQDIIESNNYFE